MGRAFIDNKVSMEDIPKLNELHKKTNPQTPVPDFGSPNTETMVLRDEADPERIVGFIHLEHALEVKEICTDPEYELRQQALSHAFTAFETRARCGDFGVKGSYNVSVHRDHHHISRFFRDGGAVPIDQNAIRFLKRLS